MIDKKVIDGHVIPGRVIFTSSAHMEHAYETEAFEDNLKVTATFFTQNDGKQTKSKLEATTFNALFIVMMRFRYEFYSQRTSSQIRSLVMQSIQQALCWLKSWWEIFQWKMVSFTWFIAPWWLLIRQLPSSSRYVWMWHSSIALFILHLNTKPFSFEYRSRVYFLYGVECEHSLEGKAFLFCKNLSFDLSPPRAFILMNIGLWVCCLHKSSNPSSNTSANCVP